MVARLPLCALRITRSAGVLLLASLMSTCTDGNRPTDLPFEPMAMLALNPVFHPELAVEGSAEVNLIRIMAYLVEPNTLLDSMEVEVRDPNAVEWEVDVVLEIPSGQNPQVVLTVELVNVTDGQETVEWSGQTAPITLTATAGTTPRVENVEVVRGPLGNLTVTAISITEPLPELLEGESIQVIANTTSSDREVPTQIFWAVLEPAVASISPTGVLTGLAPGSVRVVATAGAVADTASTVVRARAAGVVISPDGALLQSLGEEIQFQGSVVDPRGNAIQEEPVSWGLESGEVLEALGNGLFRSLSRGSTVVTATSVNHPDLSISVLVEVKQAVAAVDVTPESQTLSALGQTAQFAAQALDANENVIEGMSFTWSSSDDQVATADQTGLATAHAIGTASIFAATTSTILTVGPPEAPVAGTVGSATLVVEGLDITLSKTVDDPTPGEGMEIVYEVVAHNLGPAHATNVVIRDTIPTGLVLDSIQSTGGSWDGGTEEWTLTSLSAGSADTIRFYVTVGLELGGQFLQNEAQRTATDQTDTSPPNDVALAAITVLPAPQPHAYLTAGNTELIVGAFTPPSTPHITDANNVLSGTPGLTVTSTGTFATTNGGSVTMEADGDFSYTPVPGDAALDAFDYTVQTGATATVSITKEDMVWYVDNANPAPPGTGLSDDPFVSLVDASLAASEGGEPAAEVVIFLFEGISPYQGGITLGTNQRLQGDAAGLSLFSFPNLVSPGTAPVITNVDGDGIGLGSGSTLRGVDIDVTSGSCLYAGSINGAWVDQVNISGCTGSGIVLSNTTGTLNFSQVNVTDVSNTPLIVDGGDPVVNFTGSLVENITTPHLQFITIFNTTGGSVTLSGGPFNDASSGLGAVVIDNVAGPVSVTQPLLLSEAGGPSILVQNSTAAVSFTDVDIDNLGHEGVKLSGNSASVSFNYLDIYNDGATGLQAIAHPGTLNIADGVILTWDGAGISLQNTPINATFSSVTVNNTTGSDPAVFLNNLTAPSSTTIGTLNITSNGTFAGLWASNAGAVTVTDPESTITTTGTPAIYVNGETNPAVLDLNLASASSSNSEGPGIAFFDATGTVSIAGGSIVRNESTVDGAFHVSGGSADITYGGRITNVYLWSAYVENTSGGSVNLGGDISDVGASSWGISLRDNIGGTVNLSGALTLSTGGIVAFSATGGGTVTATASGSTISTTTGKGVDIQNTAIGPGGVTFQSVSSDGAPYGIYLLDTGIGPFAIEGDGLNPASGGTIQNSTADAVHLGSAQNVELSFLDILSPVQYGIFGSEVTNLELNGTRVTGAGSDGLHFYGLYGTGNITESVFKSSANSNFWVNNSTGTLALTVVDSEFSFAQSRLPNQDAGAGIYLASLNTADLSTWFKGTAGNGNRFESNAQRGIIATANDDAKLNLTVDGTAQPNLFTGNDRSIWLDQHMSSTLLFDIRANTFSPVTDGVRFDLGSLSTVSGKLEGQFIDNSVNGPSDFMAYGGGGVVLSQNGAGTLRSQVSGNSITALIGDWHGIYGMAGLPEQAPASTGGLDLLLLDNTIEMLMEGYYAGIQLESNGSSILCTDTRGNQPLTENLRIDFWRNELSQFLLEDHAALGPTPTDATVMTYLETENPGSFGGYVYSLDQIQGVAMGSCPLPTLPPAPPAPAPPRASGR